MRVTDLITLLQKKLKEHGNLDVGIYDDGFSSIIDLELDVSVDTVACDDHTESYPVPILSIQY